MSGVEPHDELLNVYDERGSVVGARPRREAKASGLAIGAVNALLIDQHANVLLQRRPPEKENGARWDKTVGGHVSAGEGFDEALRREAGEELFDEPCCNRIVLAASDEEFETLLQTIDLCSHAVLRRAGGLHQLRDVRRAPDGEVRPVLYHVAVYVGRTDIPVSGFRPQPSELDEVRYFAADEVDALLIEGALAPNMAFLWLTHAQGLLQLVQNGSRTRSRR